MRPDFIILQQLPQSLSCYRETKTYDDRGGWVANKHVQSIQKNIYKMY